MNKPITYLNYKQKTTPKLLATLSLLCRLKYWVQFDVCMYIHTYKKLELLINNV